MERIYNAKLGREVIDKTRLGWKNRLDKTRVGVAQTGQIKPGCDGRIDEIKSGWDGFRAFLKQVGTYGVDWVDNIITQLGQKESIDKTRLEWIERIDKTRQGRMKSLDKTRLGWIDGKERKVRTDGENK